LQVEYEKPGSNIRHTSLSHEVIDHLNNYKYIPICLHHCVIVRVLSHVVNQTRYKSNDIFTC